MTEHAEVKAKLTLEDEASGALEKVKHGFEGIGEKAHEVQHELGGMLRQAVATAAGFELFHGVESLKEAAGEVFGAARGMVSEERGLAQVMAISDRTGRSFVELQGEAHELHETLEGIGIEAGQSTASLMDAFGEIAARSKKSTEEVQEFVGTIAVAGKAVPGGVAALSEGFANMELGVIRARNPVVQLIAQMHLVKGNAKEVAKQLQKMAPDKAMEIGEEAIRRMADKAKTLPLTFDQAVQSLKDIRENIFESAGVPIMKALTGPLRQIRDYFLENEEAINTWAEGAGMRLGEMIGKGAEKLKGAFHYLEEHGDEIMDGISSAAEALWKVFQFLVEHREAIAIAFGAKTAVGMAAPLVGAASGAASVLSPVAKFVASSFSTAVPAAGAADSFVATLGVGAVALGAWAAAAYEARELQKEINHDTRATIEAENNFVDRLGAGADYLDTEYQTTLHHLVDADNELAASALQAAMDIKVLGSEAAAVADARRTKSYNEVVDRSMDQMSNLALINAKNFLEHGTRIDAQKAAHPDLAPKFYGGQTFNIKQDFKNQDPDRVVLQFRRDIVRAALNRRTSGFGTPFGL